MNISPTKVIIVANLYPTQSKPFWGTFIKHIESSLIKRNEDVKSIVLPEYGSGLRGYIKFYVAVFASLLKFNGIAYVHYVSHSVLPVIAAKIFNTKLKIILNYHGSDAFSEYDEPKLKQAIKDFICRRANKICDHIIVPSEWFKERLIEKFDIKFSEISVSYSGGVDTDVFFNERDTSVHSEVLQVLFAGRMIKEKGALIAAQCVKQALDNGYKIEATFIGSGPQKRYIENFLTNYQEVTFYDQLSQAELAVVFRQSDVFLFPSVRKGESLGLVVAEASICGCIPYAIDNGAIRELVPQSLHNSLIKSSSCYVSDFTLFLDNFIKTRTIFLSNRGFFKKFENSSVSGGLIAILKRFY